MSGDKARLPLMSHGCVIPKHRVLTERALLPDVGNSWRLSAPAEYSAPPEDAPSGGRCGVGCPGGCWAWLARWGRARGRSLVGVEQWAEIRRMHFVAGLSIKEIARRTGRDRNTVRRALRCEVAPRYARAPAGSKLDPFKDEIHRLLGQDPRLPGQRVRELIAPLGYAGGKTILDDYLREVRPLFDPPRTFQRTVYRPAEICQFDLWAPREEIPVGHGQTRRGWGVIACLGYSRAGAGALIFSTRIPDLLFGIRRCLWSLGALSETLVWDRQSGLHAGGGRPTEAFAAFCGQLRVGWHFCDAGDPQAKGVVERLQDFIEKSFE